jgi:hypothetical protein
VKLERKAMGLQLEECQVAKFALMNSAKRPTVNQKFAVGLFLLRK